MSVLALRFEGPMQSWGSSSKFQERDTAREPTKSGVIGLICSALGRARDLPVDDLASLNMAVRVDREGRVMKDFQTIQNVVRACGNSNEPTVISNRYYLSDACFVVLLEGDVEVLTNARDALNKPVWSLFLGRKSYVPSSSITLVDGIVQGDISHAVRIIPFQGRDKDERGPIRIVKETSPGKGEAVMDVPLSFSERTFGTRYVITEWLDGTILPTKEVD